LRLQNDEAWVLETRELGESDLIVSLFCRDHGGVRGVARSARKSRRRFGGTLEPLTRVRLTWSEKIGRELHRIESMDCVRSFARMQSEPAVQAAVAVVSEVAAALAHEGQADPTAFKLIGAVMEALEAGCDPWIAVRYLEYWMLRVHGLLPDLEACSVCATRLTLRPAPRVDAHGLVRCRECAGTGDGAGFMLREIDRAFLDQVRTRPPLDVRADSRIVGPQGPIDSLLRGSLQSFVEKRFRSYRHLQAMTPGRSPSK
jgi:DNA repair protein RecO (recombination protein O)